MATLGYSFSSLQNMRSAICWKRATVKGLQNALGAKTEAWLNGFARTKGTAAEHPATGATESDMEALADKYAEEIGTLAARKKVTRFVQFYGMLRVSDLKYVTLKEVTFPDENTCAVYIPCGKSDQKKTGRTVDYKKGANKSNAYTWLLAHTRAKDWMDGERLFTGAAALNKFIAAELYAMHMGGRLKFSTHSLRRGGVTTAVKRGASLKSVMATGGWKSVIVERYMDDPARNGAGWTAWD